MFSKDPRTSITTGGGVVQDLYYRVRLVIRLIGDRRIHPMLKLLPIGAAVYTLIPDLLIGPIDDALALWFGTVIFLELCPQYIVQEHVEALRPRGEGSPNNSTTGNDEIVIDGEFQEPE